MPSSVKVEGLRELSKALRAVSKDAAAELRAANREAAELVADDARSRVPVRSGRLRSSLRASGTQRGAAVKAGGTRVPYAAAVHFGSPRRGIRANPFLYEAADARRAQVVALAERRIDALINKHF